MVRLLPGDPYTAAGWLFSFSELPDIFWTQNSSIGASIDRGQWGDPLSGQLRNNASGTINYDPVNISKPFMKEGSQGELDNWSLIRLLMEWHQNGINLSAALSPVTRADGIQLIGTQSIQLENVKINSYNFPGDVNITDGATTSMISAEIVYEYIKV